MSARKTLNRLMYEYGICEKEDLSQEERNLYYSMDDDKLPDDVLFYYNKENVLWCAKNKPSTLSDIEVTNLILLKLLENSDTKRNDIKAIKKCVVYFTALSVLTLLVTLFLIIARV